MVNKSAAWLVGVTLMLVLIPATPVLAVPEPSASIPPTNATGMQSGARSCDDGICVVAGATWDANLPAVVTGDILDVTASGAIVWGEVTGDGCASVTERGAVYSTHTDPTVSTGVTAIAVEPGIGAYTATLSSLVPGTPYYVRAYAKNASGTAYGSTRIFTTPSKVATVAVGALPLAMASNQKTNRVYVANNIGNSVSVIDGASDAIVATIPVQKAPYGVAVNEVTNRIYVTNNYSNTVSVIDGGTNQVVTTIPAGSAARAVAVNDRTNRVYVTNFMAASVSVIDGGTNLVLATVSVGARPISLAINKTTNKIYVANYYGDSVTVIDGADNSVDATIPVGSSPRFIELNATTNKLYVADYRNAAVTVIDGRDNSVQTVAVGGYPWSAAVNDRTNTIYVPNGENVVILNGATNAMQSVTAGRAPQAVSANEDTNQVFVGNYNHDDRSAAGFVVTQIDGATLAKAGLAVSSNPAELLVSERANKLYVINGDSVTIFSFAAPAFARFLPLLLR